ncbi:MAG TPA: 4-hydroxy-tetrahydrodipicolinate reductase [Tissierellaceae bacterium]
MNLLINGINGRMGRTIREMALEDTFWENVHGLSRENSLPREDIEYHVLLDFTHPSALANLLKLALDKKLPLVIGTTGYSKGQIEEIKAASKEIPILYSTNMSIGMNLMFSLVEEIARKIGNDVDIEIIESHHKRKKDAPSGSAISIAEAIERGLGDKRKHQFGRFGQCPRENGEIGFHSIRGGNIVGYHEALFIGELETIKISHEAYDRKVFAKGALEAAKFIIGKEPGLYSMKDVLNI